MDYDYFKYKTILIVDDEADLREMVTSILEQDGFTTVSYPHLALPLNRLQHT